MRSRPLLLLLLPVGLLLTACGTSLGRHPPECDNPGGSMVLSVQSVPGTAYAPCIIGLKTGWEYEHLEAQSGQSVFYLDSDRLEGDGPGPVERPFLKVSLFPSCDVSGADEVESDEAGVPLFVDVEVSFDVLVTIVPEGASLGTFDYAAVLQRELENTVISDRTVIVSVDSSSVATKDRISQAHALGHTVIVISTRDVEENTASLVLPGQDQEIAGLEIDDVVEELEGVTGPASYTGSWYYLFNNGCIVYDFDAHGSGVSTIESDVQAALSLFDAEALREVARDLGYDPG